MNWTPEADAYLRRWYGTAKTAKQIGHELGCTKQSVIGRAHRLRLGGAYKQPIAINIEAPPPCRQCQWIDGEPSADAPKCGNRVKQGSRFSFCDDHHARCFRADTAFDLKKADKRLGWL